MLCTHRLLSIRGNIGPILLVGIGRIRPMQIIIDVHGLHHCYTNDTQLYFFISEWMASNRLQLNPSKYEFLWFTTPRVAVYLTTLPSHSVILKSDQPTQPQPCSLL